MSYPSENTDFAVCCPEHPNANLVEDYRAGDQICTECGLVVGDRVIDVGCEWRTFSQDISRATDPSRVGGTANPILNGCDLTTLIRGGRGDAAFVKRGNGIYAARYGLNIFERGILTGFTDISQMGSRLNLTDSTITRANELFKTVYEGKLLKGRPFEVIASACVYIACRLEDVPRSFKEVCAVSTVCKRNIGRAFKQIVKAHDINITQTSIGDYMSRFCSNLGLSKDVQKAATSIANVAVRQELVPGRAPLSVVAGAIYMASQLSNDKQALKNVSEATGVGESTMRKVYKELFSKAVTVVPTEFAKKEQLCMLPMPLNVL